MRTGCWRLSTKRSSFTSPPVEVAAETVDAAPVESELVQAAEPESAGSGPVPVVESVTDGDGDEPKNEAAI